MNKFKTIVVCDDLGRTNLNTDISDTFESYFVAIFGCKCFVIHYVMPTELLNISWIQYTDLIIVRNNSTLNNSMLSKIVEFSLKPEKYVISLCPFINQYYRYYNSFVDPNKSITCSFLHNKQLFYASPIISASTAATASETNLEKLAFYYQHNLINIVIRKLGNIILSYVDPFIKLNDTDNIAENDMNYDHQIKSLQYLLRYIVKHDGTKVVNNLIETYSSCYLLSDNSLLIKSLIDSLANKHALKCEKINSTLVIKISNCNNANWNFDELSGLTLQVIIDKIPSKTHFNFENYSNHLTTRIFGKTVLFTDVTTSTLDILNSQLAIAIPGDLGFTVLSNIQTKGVGRSGNQWLSPRGCLSFCHLSELSMDSVLGRKLSFIQHLIALSLVHAIRSTNQYAEIDIRIKWPNDIYYKSQSKIGGVLVRTYTMGTKCKIVAAAGLNVTTSPLLVGIDEIIKIYNRENNTQILCLSMEYILARTLSYLEEFIQDVQNGREEHIIDLYYKYWMHKNVNITVWDRPQETFKVIGIDYYGFLKVQSIINANDIFSIQPDNNSFDILNNCISIKNNQVD